MGVCIVQIATFVLSWHTASSWDAQPAGYEVIEGPHRHDAVSISRWRDDWTLWKKMELQSIQFCANDSKVVYNNPALRWTQNSFVQVFVMMHDRNLFDREKNRYTVDRFLATMHDVRLDSVLLWPSYPNLGIDARNQWDFYSALPGGISGLKNLVDEFHLAGIRVFFPYQPWDTATRDADTSKSRYQSDIHMLYSIVNATGADGINGDTMYGLPSPFVRSNVAACPEGGLPSSLLGSNALSWGYFSGYTNFPPVARTKFLDPRHMVLVCNRWSLNRAEELQMAFFNGIGYVIWENIWGIWNTMTDREWQIVRRTMTILQRFSFATSSDMWQPYIPRLPLHIFGSAFPVKSMHAVFFTLIRTSDTPFADIIELDVTAFPWLLRRKDTKLEVYDVYHGSALPFVTFSPLHKVIRVSGISMEAFGYGALFLTTQDKRPTWLLPFLATMQALTAKPLSDFETTRPMLSQEMRSNVPRTLFAFPSPRDRSNKIPLTLIALPGASLWYFTVDGVQIEPVLEWTRAGLERFGVGVQFPWESRPQAHHSTYLRIQPFKMMRSPVTNTEYHSFLQRSLYEPKDRRRFLQLWDHRDKEHVYEWSVPPALAQQPVVHVSLEDAQAFCAFYGLRLPHDWEWQYAASLSRHNVHGKISTKYPWGPLWNASQVPPRQRRHDALVDVGQYACTSYGICDLMGVVWEFTDSFCDAHTCSVLLRGGSLYVPVASSQMDPNWYFPPVKSNQEHGKLLMLSPGYDRAATLGFRCLQDIIAT